MALADGGFEGGARSRPSGCTLGGSGFCAPAAGPLGTLVRSPEGRKSASARDAGLVLGRTLFSVLVGFFSTPDDACVDSGVPSWIRTRNTPRNTHPHLLRRSITPYLPSTDRIVGRVPLAHVQTPSPRAEPAHLPDSRSAPTRTPEAMPRTLRMWAPFAQPWTVHDPQDAMRRQPAATWTSILARFHRISRPTAPYPRWPD